MFTAVWAFFVASTILDYIYVEPLQAQFQEEGLPLKNMTILKSGCSEACDINISIIQYEVDVTNSIGMSDSVRVQARIYEENLPSLRVLPLQPTSICAPGPPGFLPGFIYILLASPLGCISFYDWNESDNWQEKWEFALVTTTLCILGALSVAIGDLDVLDIMQGNSKRTVIVSDGNKLT